MLLLVKRKLKTIKPQFLEIQLIHILVMMSLF